MEHRISALTWPWRVSEQGRAGSVVPPPRAGPGSVRRPLPTLCSAQRRTTVEHPAARHIPEVEVFRHHGVSQLHCPAEEPSTPRGGGLSREAAGTGRWRASSVWPSGSLTAAIERPTMDCTRLEDECHVRTCSLPTASCAPITPCGELVGLRQGIWRRLVTGSWRP